MQFVLLWHVHLCCFPQFKSFDEVWGTVTTEDDYPSRKKAEKGKEDKASSLLFRSKHAVHYAVCSIPSCKKARVIYKATPLTPTQKESLSNSLEHFMYTCGGPVTVATDPLNGRVVARNSMTCTDPLEFSYYTRRARFPMRCSTCGVQASSDVKLQRDPQRAALYRTVLPQCQPCITKHLVPPVRKNLYFKKRRAHEGNATAVPGAPSTSAAPAAARRDARTTSTSEAEEGDEDEEDDNDPHHGCDADSTHEGDEREETGTGGFSSSDEDDGDAEPDELSDNEYEIESILEMRRLAGKPMEWLVKWKGYEVDRDASSSWLLRRDFSTQTAYDSLLAFERKRKRDDADAAAARADAEAAPGANADNADADTDPHPHPQDREANHDEHARREDAASITANQPSSHQIACNMLLMAPWTVAMMMPSTLTPSGVVHLEGAGVLGVAVVESVGVTADFEALDVSKTMIVCTKMLHSAIVFVLVETSIFI